VILDALTAYKTDIVKKNFPGPEHTFEMNDEEWSAFLGSL